MNFCWSDRWSLPNCHIHYLWHEQKLSKFSQYLTVFPSHFINIYLKSFGLLQIFTRNYEIFWICMRFSKSLWNFMIFNETNEIFLVKQFPFIKLRSYLLIFAFITSDFKIWLQNIGLVQTILKFWSFKLEIHES